MKRLWRAVWAVWALDHGEGANRECSKAFHFDGNGEEKEFSRRDGGEVGHVLDDRNFLPQKDAVHGPPRVFDTVDVMGVDADERNFALRQELRGVFGEEGMTLKVLWSVPVFRPSRFNEDGFARQIFIRRKTGGVNRLLLRGDFYSGKIGEFF